MSQLKDWRMIQEERAERFYRHRTLRRVLRALLDYVTEERLAEWDRQELAQQHSDRSATGAFSTWTARLHGGCRVFPQAALPQPCLPSVTSEQIKGESHPF